MRRVDEIRRRLTEAFSPTQLIIEDQSHRHAGHAGARESGGGHFAVTIEAAAFAGRNALSRHKMVYAALAGMMPGEIHALSVRATAPGEEIAR